MLYLPKLPEGETKYEKLSVTVNGQKAELQAARVSAMPYNTVWPGCQRPIDQTEVAFFLHYEADEPTEVCVTTEKPASEVVIRPRSEKIECAVNGCEIRFTIPGRGQYTVEMDGFHEALHIFVDPPRDFGVRAGDENVLYYGPGVHHVGGVYLKSHTTVYIDREAVVYGAFSALDCEDVRVCGYGVIDGSWETRVTGHNFYLTDPDVNLAALDEAGLRAKIEGQNLLWGNVRFWNCRNVRLEGVVLRDSASFSVIPAGCDNVLIDDVKTIGMWRYNSDGIDLINSANCVIRNSFLRDFDDCVVIKGAMGYDSRNNENILVENCVIWCDWGRALEIGAETNAPEYRNITFRDCDVLHGSAPCLDIQHHNWAEIHQILFDDIRVEYNKHQLPDVYQNDMAAPYDPPKTFKHAAPFGIYIINSGLFNDRYKNGRAHDVCYRNIQALTEPGVPRPAAQFKGLDDTHNIADIRIENFTIDGEKADLNDVEINEFAKGIEIR